MSIRILKQDVPLPSLVLMLVESALSVTALFFVSVRWNTPLPGWRTTSLFVAIVVLSSAAMGLYNIRLRTHLFGLAMRLVLTGVLAFAALVLILKAFPASRLTVGEYANALVLFVAAALVTRYCIGRLFREGFLRSRVLVYGTGERASAIVGLRRRTDRLSFTIVGYVPGKCEKRAVPEALIVNCGENLYDYCRRERVDEIVVALDDRRQSFPVQELLHCRVHGIGVIDIIGFLERETGTLRLDLLRPSWMIFSPGFESSWIREMIGRLFDVTASFLILSVTWPLMLLAASAIKLEDGWRAPVLYRQLRVGKDGRMFTTLKLRSMKLDAEADGVARWASKDDDRVTAVGSWLRPSRIDELPQLWNVLRGEMRFVGPRPERPEFVTTFDDRLPYYRERHSVPPGLTGWAQLRYAYGASEQDAIEKLKYDLYYVKNHNLVLDLVILIQTVEVIVFGKGAR